MEKHKSPGILTDKSGGVFKLVGYAGDIDISETDKKAYYENLLGKVLRTNKPLYVTRPSLSRRRMKTTTK